jgi:hypothetical protein
LRGDDGERITGLAAMAEISELRDFDRVHRVIEECHSRSRLNVADRFEAALRS